MSFGDSGPDDAYTTGAPPDPEQVARRLHELRDDHGLEGRSWDGLNDRRRAVLVEIVAALLAWLARQGHDVG